MNTTVVDDEVAINLERRPIVAARGERVLAIAIDPQPATPFDGEVLLRQRRRIRGDEVEIDLSLDAHASRPDPVRVGVELRRNPPLRPHPQDWHEEDRHEKNTCHVPSEARRGEPGGNRTLNPQIKSLLLCQLSYRPKGSTEERPQSRRRKP